VSWRPWAGAASIRSCISCYPPIGGDLTRSRGGARPRDFDHLTRDEACVDAGSTVLIRGHSSIEVSSNRDSALPNDDCALRIPHRASAIAHRAHATPHGANATTSRAPEIATRAGSNASRADSLPLRAHAAAHHAVATAFDNATIPHRACAHDDCAPATHTATP